MKFKQGSKARVGNLVLALIALVCLSNAGWIHAKAWLAQHLIARAWSNSIEIDGGPIKPWPWADTHPVAKLTTPDGQELFVLSGAQGNALAFGPGLVESSDPIGHGFSVIGGHRDTHFRFLQNLAKGDFLKVQDSKGHRLRYRVEQLEVVNIHQQPLWRGDENKLVLVTCFPFDSLQSDSALRWVATASLE